jgi:hypothetical protein
MVFAYSGEWAMHMQGWTEAPAQSSPANQDKEKYNDTIAKSAKQKQNQQNT